MGEGLVRSYKLLTIALLACAVWGLAFSVPAEAVSVRAEVNTQQITISERLIYTVVVNGGGQVSRPAPPEVSDFTVFSSGTSSSYSLLNGRMTSTAKYTYVMIPRATGRFTIPPVDVRVNGQLYRTEPIGVEVADTKSGFGTQAPAISRRPTRRPQAGLSSPQTRTQSPSSRAPQAARAPDREIFIQAWVDKDSVYVNEQILLNYTVYTLVNASFKGFKEEPKHTGFWVEEFPPKEQLEQGRARVSGREYNTADVRTVALFPTESGNFTIEPGVIQAEIQVREQDPFGDDYMDSFFGRSMFRNFATFTRAVPRLLDSDPIGIDVKELPLSGKPESFSGAVGDFDISASIDVHEVEENDPITLTVKIFGEGNIQTIREPKWPEIESFKYFDSGSSTDVNTFERRVIGEKVFEKVLVPQKEGAYTIDAIEFSYFDPVDKRYRTVQTKAFKVKVLPGPEEEVVSRTTVGLGGQREIELLGRDIQYIRRELGDLKQTRGPIYESPFFMGTQLLPLLLFIAALIFARRQERLGSDVRFARLHRARRHFEKRLKQAQNWLQQSRSEVFYPGDKFNVPSAGLSVDEVVRLLTERQVETALIQKMKGCLEACHQARFAPGSGESKEMGRVMETTQDLVKQLERAL
jgi:hypothetical protein